MKNIETELHRIRVAMLDPHNPRYQELWAAQQALAWVNDPENFSPPFAVLTGSEAAPKDCLAQSHRQPS
jgi:hypothetical protein